MADIAVTAAQTLLLDLWSFIRQKINLEKDVQDDIQAIEGWLNTMRAFLDDNEGIGGSKILQDQVRQIRDIAYDIEDAIDEFMFSVPHHFHRHRLTEVTHDLVHWPTKRKALNQMSMKIKDVRKKTANLMDLNALRTNYINIGEGSSSIRRLENHLANKFPVEDEMVGFETPKAKILDELLSGELMHSVISVVGPPGSGKTTLVRNIYESKRVQENFQCFAWVQVSRPLDPKKTMRSILLQFCEGIEEPYLQDTDSMLETLNKYFRHKSYVIALDDVWSKQDCDRITNKLPTSSICSRIIITSRISDVASSRHHRHVLTRLPEDIAWSLFCKWAFPTRNGRCPPELQELAEKFVRKCEGLPLAVAALGSLLSNKRQIPLEWNKAYDGLGKELSDTLLPSYTNLPRDLKRCFLYFGTFPEDYSIPHGKLIGLWIAEGFVVQRRNRTLEEAAEDNLNELIERNLIHVCARDVDGRIRSCRVLNLVHQFIINKAEEENFMTILSERSNQHSGEKVRRISIGSGNNASLKGENLIHARSAFIFARACNDCLNGFKLLKVLDMQGLPIESFPMVVIKLSLLRYLSLRETNISSIPASIKNLALLETLDLRQTNVSQLPKAIFQLHYLRHLLVYRDNVKSYATFDGVKGVEICDGISRFGNSSNLQKLSLVKANAMLIKKLSDLINLRELGLFGVKAKDGRKICECIQKMKHLLTLDIRAATEKDHLELDFPDQPSFEFLQRLYLKGRLSELPRWIPSLHSLIKISLMWSRLNVTPLRVLETLPNVMELELIDAYTGELLEFRANTFKKLKILRIDLLGHLNTVRIEENAMPNIEKLLICRCNELEILPLGINGLTHLEEFILYDMPTNFINSLLREDRWMVDHVRIIHSYSLGSNQKFSLQNLSNISSVVDNNLGHR